MFLEFGDRAALSFIEKMYIIGNEKTEEEGFQKEIDEGEPEWST